MRVSIGNLGNILKHGIQQTVHGFGCMTPKVHAINNAISILVATHS